jgi:hypothetical protein
MNAHLYLGVREGDYNEKGGARERKRDLEKEPLKDNKRIISACVRE